MPGAPSGSGSSRCGNGSVTLTATPGSNANNIKWYDAATGGSLVYTGTSFSTPSLTSTTTYYAASYNSSTGAISSTRVAVQAIINPMPGSPSGSGSSRCGTGTVVLTVSPGANGDGIRWYTSSYAGELLYTGSSFTTPSISTTTTYYAATYHSSTGCENPTRTAVVATVNPIPVAPTVTGGSRCGPGTVGLSASPGTNGNIIRWYTASTGGTHFAQSNSWTTGTLSSSATYYVSSYNTTTGCESAGRTAVVATVNQIPDLASGSNQTRCGSGTITLTATPGSNGTTIRWYNSVGTFLAEGTTYSPNVTTTTTFYAASYNSSTQCEDTDRKAIVANVDPVTVAGSISAANSHCGSGIHTFSISGYTGTILRWESRYKNGSGSWTSWSTVTETDNVTNVSPTLSVWSSGVRTYEVRAAVQSGSTCSTLYATKSVTVDPVTVAGSISAASTQCSSGSHSFSISGYTGTIERWESRYKNGSGSWTSWSTVTETDNVTSVSPTLSEWSSGVRTYEVRAVVKSGTCNTLYATKSVTVDPATVAGSISATSNQCSSGGHSFNISGYTGTIERWESRYKNGSGSWTSWSTVTETDNVTSVSPTLSEWSSGVRTYEVRAVVKSGTCSTLYATKSVTVDPATVAGSISASNERCGSGSHSFSISGYTGTIHRWELRYKNGSGSWTSWSTVTETDNVTSVSPTLTEWSGGVRTYEVRAVVQSGVICSTLYPTKTVSVNPIPSLASGVDQSRCGSGIITLSATPGSNGNTIRWYSLASGGAHLAESVTYSPNISSTTTYYAATYNSTTGCEDPDRISITATVDPATVAGNITAASDRCGSGSHSFSISGYTGTIERWESRYQNGSGSWTSWSTVTETDNVTSVNPTLSEWSGGVRTYEVRATVKSGTCSTLNSTKSVTVYPATIAGSISASSDRCGSGSHSFSISGYTGTIHRWELRYKNGSGSWTSWSTVTETDNVTSVSPTLTEWSGGVRTYEVRAVVQSGVICSTLYPTKTVSVNPIPSLASGVDQSRCGSGIITLSATPGSNGNTIRWYSLASGGAHLAESVTYSPNISSTTTYYAATYNSTTGCEDPDRIPIAATVIPDIDNFSLSGGASIRWQDSETTTTFIGSADNETAWTWSISPLIAGSVNATGVVTWSPSFSGFATITAVASNICFTETANTTVEVVASPEIIVMGNPAIGGAGDEVVLVADRVYDSYTWKKDGSPLANGNNQSFIATQTGVYTLEATLSGLTGVSSGLSITSAGSFDPGDYNYVMSTAVQIEGVMNDTQVAALTGAQRIIGVQYADGLGRASQIIQVEASPSQKHFAAPIKYDEFGRKSTTYLPYVVTSNGGVYQSNPLGNTPANYSLSPQYNFYQNEANVAHDTEPYIRTILEKSALGRVSEQGSAGTAWQPGAGSITMSYNSNAINEVIQFELTGGNIPISPNGYYPAGQLTKVSTEDEDGNQMVEFTDKLGRTILKRVETGETNDPWADTYYLYDVYNNLAVVLPPEAVKTIDDQNLTDVPPGYELVTTDYEVTLSNYTGSSYMYTEDASVTILQGVTIDPETEITSYGVGFDFLNKWAFQYRYDGRQRMTAKHVPGAGWVYMVYDELDRLVLTQDAKQRESYQWTFTKYDRFSRPILTGFYTHGSEVDQSTMQAIVDTDNASNPVFESIGSGVLNYTNNAFPRVSGEVNYLTATYYDSYTNLPSGFGLSYVQELGNSATENTAVKGLVVGAQTRVLDGTNTWLKTVSYYDDRYRVIQSQGTNHLSASGFDRVTNKFDFTGKVTQTKTTHNDGNSSTEILEKFFYDHANRLTKATHQVGTDPEIIMVENTYNEIGELIDKELHSTDMGSSFAQSIDYGYNIRGWLTNINDAGLDGGDGDYFGMELFYNTTVSDLSNTSLLNGNISASKWSDLANNGQVQSAYTYSYDPMNRLRTADYVFKLDAYQDWTPTAKFDVSIPSYDLNGNIKGLQRYATSTSLAEDNLTYAYSGNQLLSVTDNGNPSKGFEDNNTSGNDYDYDVNGNMIQDANKDITGITYNHLNLPELVNFSGNRSIAFKYDAAGIKLSKTVNDDGNITVTDYSGAFIYQDGQFQQLATTEGRVRPSENDANSNDFVYDYYLKDHLGNTRVTFTTETVPVVYLATMETDETPDEVNLKEYEESLFLNIDAVRDSLVFNHTAIAGIANDEAVRLNGDQAARQMGPGKLLQVMPGDVIDMEVFAYHTGGFSGNTQNSALNILAPLIAGIASAAPVGSETANISPQVNAYSTQIIANGGNSSLPRAYLNYVLFDKDFKYITAGFSQVGGTANQFLETTLSKGIAKAGYIYVYLSNESNKSTPVYFDDFRITHTKGVIMQEDHYYPFGMNILALSSNAPLSTSNHFKYNGNEEQIEFSLDLYDFNARIYDPILGRFIQIDALAEEQLEMSAYQFAWNSPIRLSDPSGLKPEKVNRLETIYTYTDPESGETESVEVNDGVDRTVRLNWHNFQEAKFWANEINNGYISEDMFEAYNDFFWEHASKGMSTFDWFFGQRPIPAMMMERYVIAAEPAPLIGDLMTGGPGKKKAASWLSQFLLKKAFHKHHIIPKAIWKKYSRVLKPFLKNGPYNLKKLPAPFHGNHPAYNEYVGKQLEALIQQNGGQLTEGALRTFQHKLRLELGKAYNSGKKLNDYFKGLN